MINLNRKDENFNLDTVSNEELYEGLKEGFAASIRTLKGFEEIDSSNISLEDHNTYRKESFGADGNLYPLISLNTKARIPGQAWPTTFQFLMNPFDIKMLIFTAGITSVQPEVLQEAFVTFMTNRFPEGNYEEKRAEYKEMEAVRKRVYDRMVFGE